MDRAITIAKDLFAKKIAEAIKVLCENKHLYQNHRVDKDEFDECVIQALQSTKVNDARRLALIWIKVLSSSHWDPNPPFNVMAAAPTKKDREVPCEFALPMIKMYCPECDRIEPYYPVGGYDLTKQYRNIEVHPEPIQTQQRWVLLYQCQSCRFTPVTLLVGRTDWKFFIFGRYPIEQVIAPAYIPRKQAKYYSDARIAYNSGQVLAALFLLRTFIEQFVKSFVGSRAVMVDKAIEEYMASLPNDFTSRFPSLRKCYENLSAAIHCADASSELFIDTAASIDLHFDAKRLFETKQS